MNVPSPPLVKMLQEYLPQLPVRCKIQGKVLPPPDEILNTLRKAVTLRNRVAHASGMALKYDTVEEILLAVRDVLWLLDYYRGMKWAYDHARLVCRPDSDWLTPKISEASEDEDDTADEEAALEPSLDVSLQSASALDAATLLSDSGISKEPFVAEQASPQPAKPEIQSFLGSLFGRRS